MNSMNTTPVSPYVYPNYSGLANPTQLCATNSQTYNPVQYAQYGGMAANINPSRRHNKN